MRRFLPSLGLAAVLSYSSCAPHTVSSTSYVHPSYRLQLADQLSWRTVERAAEFAYLAHRGTVCCLKRGHGDFVGQYYETNPWRPLDGDQFFAGLVLSFDRNTDQVITARELHTSLAQTIPFCEE